MQKYLTVDNQICDVVSVSEECSTWPSWAGIEGAGNDCWSSGD